MQTLLQLNPPIPMKTPRGEGMAVMVIDYGPDFDLWWTVILTKGEHVGEIWTYSNPEVRGVENISLGRQVSLNGKMAGGAASKWEWKWNQSRTGGGQSSRRKDAAGAVEWPAIPTADARDLMMLNF